MKRHDAYLVHAGLSIILVEQANSEGDARKKALAKVGLQYKPYLARGWKIRRASEDDLRAYAAHAEGYRPSQPTHKSAKRKTVQERLL